MKKLGSKIKLFFFVCMLLAGSLILAAKTYGKVAATESSFGQAGMVFVAGNPDLYPLEYYDKKDECYKGAMPLLLEEISRELGTDFVYISSGTSDKRDQLAENRQVEVVSGCMISKDLPDHTAAGSPLFPITIDGKTYEVGFAYTELASEELRDKMEEYLDGKSSRELMNLVASEAARGQSDGISLGAKLVLGAEALLLLGAVLVWRCRRKRSEEKEEIDKMVDPVTGVGNKDYFLRQFSSFISDSTRPLYYMLYLCFDVERVNSYYGEGETEDILRYAADVLSSYVEDSDFFARVTEGGFAAACQKVGKERMEEWTKLVLKKVNEYSEKFNKDYRPDFCAGIYKLKSDDTSYETVFYAAQQGYREALHSRQSYVFCNEGILRSARERQQLGRDMLQAIAGHQFHSYLQFMTDGKTGKILGAEVLSRWQHPQRGLLMPGKYIEDMEKNETVIDLDFYMFEQVCRLLQRFQEEGKDYLILFCNISRKTVSFSGFADKIYSIAGRYHFDHHKLCMEITESSMFENDKVSIINIQKCKDMGFMIAMDDVGSGYSSLQDMIQYPIDLVKIDRGVLLAAAHEKGRLLLQGMNELFHRIQIQTLCEGIETKGQYEMIQEIGIDYMQGFYIQRALPVKEAMRWLKEREG